MKTRADPKGVNSVHGVTTEHQTALGWQNTLHNQKRKASVIERVVKAGRCEVTVYVVVWSAKGKRRTPKHEAPAELTEEMINEAFNEFRPGGEHPVWHTTHLATGGWIVECGTCGTTWSVYREGEAIRFKMQKTPTSECE